MSQTRGLNTRHQTASAPSENLRLTRAHQGARGKTEAELSQAHRIVAETGSSTKASYVDDDNLLNSAQTRARVGNVSNMCIWRWLRDERVQFRQRVQINRRSDLRLGDLRRWQSERTTKST